MSDDGLGDLRSTHTQGRLARRAVGVAFGCGLVGALAALLTHHLAPFVIGIAVLLAILPIWILSELLIGLASAVEVWDDGIVVRRRWTDPATLRWDDVDAVYLDLDGGAKVVLTTHTGRRVALPRGLTRSGDILHAIDRHVERPLLAPARRALGVGEPLTFGPLVLDGEGITRAGETIPWSAIAHVEAEPDRLAFFTKQKDESSRWRFDVAVRELPHPRVLIALLASRVKVEASAIWAE